MEQGDYYFLVPSCMLDIRLKTIINGLYIDNLKGKLNIFTEKEDAILLHHGNEEYDVIRMCTGAGVVTFNRYIGEEHHIVTFKPLKFIEKCCIIWE